ncbi:hypothetical protein KIN20_011299 [Parelaphostrongylus tenuis]|uniref:Uncharacterized protein n=1 Tax=Parelaphostrongylus tenuis TaxID=148309 RepID=A0AAD5MV83_PARTN|nr:hypothetical protein KIN20_011299 [Parelaphostrongylus tenuis]
MGADMKRKEMLVHFAPTSSIASLIAFRSNASNNCSRRSVPAEVRDCLKAFLVAQKFSLRHLEQRLDEGQTVVVRNNNGVMVLSRKDEKKSSYNFHST